VVVTRQAPGLPADTPLAAGLPAPLSLGRARIALALRADEVLFADAFPLAPEVLPTLAPRSARLAGPVRTAGRAGGAGPRLRQPWLAAAHRPGLCAPRLRPGPAAARQHPRNGRRRGAALEAAPAGLPRLDGELLWPDGAAVAWREWAAWRAGQVGALLVRRIDGVNLVEDWPCHSLQSA
jgi:phosphoribosyl-dephospho-CoA transferase